MFSSFFFISFELCHSCWLNQWFDNYAFLFVCYCVSILVISHCVLYVMFIICFRISLWVRWRLLARRLQLPPIALIRLDLEQRRTKKLSEYTDWLQTNQIVCLCTNVTWNVLFKTTQKWLIWMIMIIWYYSKIIISFNSPWFL